MIDPQRLAQVRAENQRLMGLGGFGGLGCCGPAARSGLMGLSTNDRAALTKFLIYGAGAVAMAGVGIALFRAVRRR